MTTAADYKLEPLREGDVEYGWSCYVCADQGVKKAGAFRLTTKHPTETYFPCSEGHAIAIVNGYRVVV